MITPYSNIISVTTLEAFLLDYYPNAAAAYSLRKLRADYSGSAIRVRRSSDNAELDIGFDSSGELDTTALLAHVGTGGTDNGFIETWYDQSGSGNDATQTSTANQPQIVSSGSVFTENGKPAVKFDGSNDLLRTTGTPFSATENTLIGVSKQDSVVSQYKRVFCIGDYRDGRYLGSNIGTNDMLAIFNNSTLTCFGGVSTSQNLSIMYNNSTNGVLRQNGTQINTVTADNTSYGNQDLFIGSDSVQSSQEIWNGRGQEFIFYPTSQSSNISGIETNINDFYSIYYVATNSEYQDVLDYADSQGYQRPSYAQCALQDALVGDLKDAGVWSNLDLFYVFATDGDSDFASINWKDPNNYEITEVNSPTFTTNQGFQSDGTSYLNTSYNVLNESTNFELLSNGLAYYVTDVGSIHHGARDSNDGNQIYYAITPKRHQISARDYAITDNTYFASVRNGSDVAGYENNTNVLNYTNTPTALPNEDYLLLALNSGGTPVVVGTAEISFFTMGGQFNNSDMYNAWNDYFTAI